jgi:WhiB family redox-sensing transcriptional regulator
MELKKIFDTDAFWMKNAACKGKTEIFYGPLRENPTTKVRRENEAKLICESCPVAIDCRDYARRNGEYGLWGSETEDERFKQGFLDDKTLRRKRKQQEIRDAKKARATGIVLELHR